MNTTLKVLDAEIERLVEKLDDELPEHGRYAAIRKEVVVLIEARKNLSPIDPNTVLLIAANILGIVIVLSYEKLNIVTSKAFSQIMRPR